MLNYKKDFPIFYDHSYQEKKLHYLDSAATTQKPQVVLDKINEYYQTSNANPHRGAYDLSMEATLAIDCAREKVKNFIGAAKVEEILFTKNATEALNLVAYSYANTFLQEGDEIVLAISEHHSNLVPWQIIAKAKKLNLVYLYTDENARITEAEIKKKITTKTKLVALAYISNVTGVINPIQYAIELAHKVGALVVVDGTQSTPHLKVNVSNLDADFYAFSAHKMLGPMGIGVLYGKENILNSMPPFLFGGDMIEYVEQYETTFAPLPQKFEAGTQNVGGAVGLGAAITYLEQIGMDNVYQHEVELTGYLLEKLQAVDDLLIVPPHDLKDRIGVVSFNVKNAHPHDVATILNADKIAVRSGHHCAQPFMKYLNVQATCRASLYIYNTTEDIDALVESLKNVKRWLQNGSV